MNNKKTIEELKKERAAFQEQARILVERETDMTTGKMSAGAIKKHGMLDNKIQALSREISLREETERIDQEIAEEHERILLGKPFVHPGDNNHDGGNNGKNGKNSKAEKMAAVTASDAYSGAFWGMMRNNKPMTEIADTLRKGENEDGGYTVPDQFEKQLVEALKDNNVIRSLARVIPADAGLKKIPVSVGGMKAQWMEEGDPIPETEATFSRVVMDSFKLGTLVKVSNELLHDSTFDVGEYVARAFRDAIGDAEEEAFIFGTGEGQPTGILHDTLGAQVGTVSESEGVITFDDIIHLYYSLKAPYRKRAVLLCNESVLMELMTLKDKNGQYLWKPSLDAAKPGTLFGYPIHTSTFMPRTESGKKPLIFGDMSYYWVTDRGHRSFKRLNEMFATKDLVGFMTTERVDGKLILPEAVKALKMK